jgi:hypothetical protein
MTRRLVLRLSFVLMESLWLYALGAIVTAAADRPGPAYLPFLIAEGGGMLLAIGLMRVDLPKQGLIAFAGVMTFIAVVTIAGLAVDAGSITSGWAGVGRFLQDPGGTIGAAGVSVMVIVALVVAAWIRGVIIAQERLDHGRVLHSFSCGTAVLFLGLTFGEQSVAKDAVNASALPLLATGLLTLSLVNLRDAYAEVGQPRGGTWLLITAGTIIGIVIAGTAIGVLPFVPFAYTYDHAIAPALDVAAFLFAWAIVIIGYPFAWLATTLLEHLSGRHGTTPPPLRSVAPGNVEQQLHGGTSAFFAVLLFASKLIFILLVVALLAWLAYAIFRRLRRPPVDGEDRASIRGEGSLRHDLLALLQGLRRRADAGGDVREPNLPGSIREVRRLYLRVLGDAKDRGHPRRPAATPLEFADELEGIFVSHAPAELTDLFVNGRYGRIEPDSEALAELRRQLRRLS